MSRSTSNRVANHFAFSSSTIIRGGLSLSRSTSNRVASHMTLSTSTFSFQRRFSAANRDSVPQMAIQTQLVPFNPAAAAGPHKSYRLQFGATDGNSDASSSETFAGCAGAAQHPSVGSTTTTHGYDRAASKLGHRRGAAWASARSYVCAVSSMLIPTTCSQRGTRRLMKGKRLSPPLTPFLPWSHGM